MDQNIERSSEFVCDPQRKWARELKRFSEFLCDPHREWARKLKDPEDSFVMHKGDVHGIEEIQEIPL